MKRAITPDDPARRQADKENFLIDSIMRLSIDNQARKELATRRCLNSQIGDRLKLSKKPASKAEFSYQSNQYDRIQKIEDSIFVDAREPRTDKRLNQ